MAIIELRSQVKISIVNGRTPAKSVTPKSTRSKKSFSKANTKNRSTLTFTLTLKRKPLSCMDVSLQKVLTFRKNCPTSYLRKCNILTISTVTSLSARLKRALLALLFGEQVLRTATLTRFRSVDLKERGVIST